MFFIPVHFPLCPLCASFHLTIMGFGSLGWRLPAALPFFGNLLFLASGNVAQAAWDARSIALYEDASGQRLCPRSCASSGYDPRNWTNFHGVQELIRCHDQVKLLHYSLHTESPLSSISSPIQACAYATDEQVSDRVAGVRLGAFPGENSGLKTIPLQVQLSQSSPTLEDSEDSEDSAATDQVLGAIQNLLLVLASEDPSSSVDDATSDATILSAHYGNAVVGMYMGERIHKRSTAAALLGQIFDYIKANRTPVSLTAQVCGSNIPVDYVAGVAIDITGETALDRVRDSLRTWTEAGCVSAATGLDESPEDSLISDSVWATDEDFAILDKILNWEGPLNTTLTAATTLRSVRSRARSFLNRRAMCQTIRVSYGDTCGTLATKCGIHGDDFMVYNSYNPTLCGNLRPGQPVCCSSGEVPDIRPKPNADGECFSYRVKDGEWCDSIAAAHGLELEELEEFNEGKVWGYMGCGDLFIGTILCLSEGTPPMPDIVENAVCGPQMSGTTKPAGENHLSLACQTEPVPS